MPLFGANTFDLFFFIVVVGVELHWYLQGKKDEREFEQFKRDTYDQFLEVNKRLEIALEKEDSK